MTVHRPVRAVDIVLGVIRIRSGISVGRHRKWIGFIIVFWKVIFLFILLSSRW
jgi:hypothetical protein